MEKDKLVLTVDEHQLIDKLYAHQAGIKHYAYSVFIFNHKHELLLQQRALEKYHSGGLWSNTCCSHPLSYQPGDIRSAAEQRLFIEMGINCPVDYLFTLEYHQPCGELIENEVDLVFAGTTDTEPTIHKNEVADYKWMSLEQVITSVRNNPDDYTKWFAMLILDHARSFKDYLSR